MRIRALSVVAIVVCSACAAGCANFVTIDGYHLYESKWNEVRADVNRRAAFDLKCDVNALRLSVLKAECVGLATKACSPEQVGVRGCGQQAVYVDVGEKGWVLNTNAAN